MRDAMSNGGIRPRHRERRDAGRGDRGGPSTIDLPKFPDSYFGTDDSGRSYLQSAFVARKNVDPWARYLAYDARPKLTRGQVRRFFNHCRDIERRLKVGAQSWAQVSASFESLCFHAQYAKEAGKIPDEFRKIIDENVKRVTSSEDPKTAFLNGFLPHFEALVGFGTAYMRKDS